MNKIEVFAVSLTFDSLAFNYVNEYHTQQALSNLLKPLTTSLINNQVIIKFEECSYKVETVVRSTTEFNEKQKLPPPW